MNKRFLRFLSSLVSSKKIKYSDFPESFAKILKDKIVRLEKLLGYKIKDPTFYVKALTHRSYNEFDDFNLRSNERLEFLGDSVLSVVVADFLFKNFPSQDEGFLTKTRAKLVNRTTLAKAADKIHLLDYMLVSNAFMYSTNGVSTITADAVEALIGAIYVDKGLEKAKKFVDKIIIKPFAHDSRQMEDKNYKSQLLEYAQANKLHNPFYKILKEEGPQHQKTFTIEVFINDKSYGCGVGKSKKEAEQNAAKDSLKKIFESKINLAEAEL